MINKRVVFLGTPDFAVPILEMLIAKTNVILVVSQPDKEVGRKRKLQASPIKRVALEHQIPVFTPVRIRKDYEMIKEVKPDLIVSCAYGQIVPQEVLDIPSCGAVNVHASLLPKYRGAAPIQWAIMNGESKTGVTLMYMDAGMDTGDTFAKKEVPILATDDVGSMHTKLSLEGASLLENNLEAIFTKTTKRCKQDDTLASMAPMIKREDEYLSFADTGENIINKIRALSPWPLAYFLLNNQEIKIKSAEFKKEKVEEINKIKITKKSLGISCLDGYIYLLEIKPMGKKLMPIASFLNGLNKENDMVVNNEK